MLLQELYLLAHHYRYLLFIDISHEYLPWALPPQDIPLEQLERYEFRNRIARKMIAGMRIPVLPIWRLTALEHLSHPQSLRGGKSADCTHFCPKAGGMFEMWSHMFYNYLEALLAHEAHFSKQFAQ